MKFNLSTVLELLPAIGPVAAAIPQFKAVFDQIVGTFEEDDQATLKEAYADLIADNDAGHARLQAKLAAINVNVSLADESLSPTKTISPD